MGVRLNYIYDNPLTLCREYITKDGTQAAVAKELIIQWLIATSNDPIKYPIDRNGILVIEYSRIVTLLDWIKTNNCK